VIFFGRLSDVAGIHERSMPDFDGSIEPEELIELLSAGAPDLAEALRAPAIRICINLEILPRSERVLVSKGDEVAFLPPMSGG
jgi:sulfur-carrier protein